MRTTLQRWLPDELACQCLDAIAYLERVGDDFYWGVGYNAWAEASRIVVLYPQAAVWDRRLDVTGLTGNPRGCWDWWGYSGADYFRQSGKQMHAVRQMIDRLLPD